MALRLFPPPPTNPTACKSNKCWFSLYFLKTGSENLHVSHILQKAKIEVSEDGTKASAATSKPWVTRQRLALVRGPVLPVPSSNRCYVLSPLSSQGLWVDPQETVIDLGGYASTKLRAFYIDT